MATIAIQVDDQTARQYAETPQADKIDIDAMLSILVKNAIRTPRSIFELMDEISVTAKQNGLTEAVLDDILNDPNP